MRRFLTPSLESTPAAEYTFTIATKDRVDEIVKLREKLSKESTFINTNTVEREEANIQALSEPNGYYQLAMYADTIVGMCLTYRSKKDNGVDAAHIGLIAVLEKHGGKGIATGMIKNVIQWAKEKNCDGISLNVDVKNPSARRLYKALGFQDVEKFSFYEMQKRI